MATKNKIVGSLSILIGLILLFYLSKTIFHYVFHHHPHIEMVEGPHIIYESATPKVITIELRKHEVKLSSDDMVKNKNGHHQVTVLNDSLQKLFHVKLFDKLEVRDDKHEHKGALLAISDIEGNFNFLKQILIGNDVIDTDFNWIFGSGRLVINGDLFDRGNRVTECLWLIYKLEKEAPLYGGRVHVMLGNHEIMALSGDDRYLNPKYKRIMHAVGKPYHEFFGENTELGRWIRTKNTIEIINRTLFVHAGIDPSLESDFKSISELNKIVRKQLRLMDQTVSFNVYNSILGMENSPLWYRGYFKNELSQLDIDQLIQELDVDRIVVGHTVVDDITKLYDGKIIAIDMHREAAKDYAALLILNDKLYRVNSKGNRRLLE